MIEHNDIPYYSCQYKRKCEDLQKVISQKNEHETTFKKTILERDHLKYDLKKAQEEIDKLQLKTEELDNKAEDQLRTEARNCSLEEQLNNLNSLVIARVILCLCIGHSLLKEI